MNYAQQAEWEAHVPRISVIIPTYNRSGVVRDAISCVLSQTEADSEIIVVDDGSTDDTRAVVENFGDSRVRYFHKTNGGPSSARNSGLCTVGGGFLVRFFRRRGLYK